MTVQEVLLKAAEEVEKGWCQNKFVDYEKGEVCVTQAIWNAAAADETSVYQAARKAFSEVIGNNIVDWNDIPGRTQQEVAEALRKAAAL